MKNRYQIVDRKDLKKITYKKFEMLVTEKYKEFMIGDSSNNAFKKFYEDYEKSTGEDIRQKVRKWRSYDSQNKKYIPLIEELINICNILDCDIDYLLSNQDIARKDVYNASETLQLQYKTVEAIKNYDEELKDTINVLVTNNDLLNWFLLIISKYSFRSLNNQITIENMLGSKTVIKDSTEITSFMRADAQESFSMLLNNVDKIYSKRNLQAMKDIAEQYKLEIELSKRKGNI